MKKALLLFALVAISAVSINAQDNLKWGVVAGMNVSKYTITGFDSRIGFHAGVKAELGLSQDANGSGAYMVIAQIEEGKMEIGMGQHGEGGGGLTEMKTADETAAIMIDALLRDLDIKKGEKLLVIVNGVGATTLMEQLIVFRKCCHYLAEKGIEVVANIVGEVLTVQEMAGFQLFIAHDVTVIERQHDCAPVSRKNL